MCQKCATNGAKNGANKYSRSTISGEKRAFENSSWDRYRGDQGVTLSFLARKLLLSNIHCQVEVSTRFKSFLFRTFLQALSTLEIYSKKKFWRQHSKHKKLLDNVWSAFGIIATNKVSSARWKQRIVQLGAMQWLNNQSFKISFFLQSWATQLLSSERSDSLKSSIIITLRVLLVFTTIRGIKHANIGPKQAK